MADELNEGFKSLSLPPVIDSTSTDFITEFYEPLLSKSVTYKRGAGYFTTNWLESAARGITELADNGGTAKWITSPILDEADWEAIKTGNKAKRDRTLRTSLSETVENLSSALESDTRNAIAWMIADGLLELKLAVPEPSLGGDFHDKFGIFEDDVGNRVGFQSSQNDSKHALTNYEGYRVDCDWISEREASAVGEHEKRFDHLWNNENEHVRTYDIPESIEEQIAELRDYEARPYEKSESVTTSNDFTLREYQQEAVDAWFENDCRGLFQMATGVGKTFTALAALEQYTKSVDDPLLTVIAVPVTHLATQWKKEMEVFDLPEPHLLFGSVSKNWKQELSRVTTNIELDTRGHEVVITTHQSLYTDDFQERIERLPGPIAFIGDEVHGLGSDEQRKGLIDAYDARMGLSATPERYYDEAGSRYLLNYFDGIVYEYPLADAIPEYLTPYEYHPIIVEMTQEEIEKYKKQSRKIAAVASNEEIDDETVSQVASQRADIVKSAERKYNTLKDILKQIKDPHHLLIYTNDKQISEVQSILMNSGIIHQHKFTNEEDEDTRDQLLDSFEKGEYKALVAMKCLDEGVDVPATERAILMSNSGNPKQFIQRRGRVLRPAEGKDKAVIYDMFVVPTMNPGDEIPDIEKKILKKELERFEEFAENAVNRHSAWNTIDRVRRAYKL